MNESEELKIIESSLNTVPVKDTSQHNIEIKVPSLTDTLTVISTVMLKMDSQLDSLRLELKRVNDVLEGYSDLSLEVHSTALKVDASTAKIITLADVVSNRLKTVDVLETKYNKLIGNVHAVLAKLEKSL